MATADPIALYPPAKNPNTDAWPIVAQEDGTGKRTYLVDHPQLARPGTIYPGGWLCESANYRLITRGVTRCEEVFQPVDALCWRLALR